MQFTTHIKLSDAYVSLYRF